MASEKFMDKLRSFFGFPVGVEPPRNEFRNPIWGSDDDDDDDELYTRHRMGTHFEDPHEIAKQMTHMLRVFGGMFGDVKTFFHDDLRSFFADEQLEESTGTLFDRYTPDSEQFNSNAIREHYLKPGFHKKRIDEPRDIDLDGKITSQEISGLLKKQEEDPNQGMIMPFNATITINPGHCISKTVITTSVKKADGSVETTRIVKNGSEIIEKTTTSTTTDPQAPTPINSESN